MLVDLKRVQKPERMQKFLGEPGICNDVLVAQPLCTEPAVAVSPSCAEFVLEAEDILSHTAVQKDVLVGRVGDVKRNEKDKQENDTRGPGSCEDQKEDNKRHQELQKEPPPKSGMRKPDQLFVSHEGVVPPRKARKKITGSLEPPVGTRSVREAMDENPRAGQLSAAAHLALQQLPFTMFYGPGGKRLSSAADLLALQRRGVLDLYSGEAGVAKAISRKYKVWVCTVDFSHGSDQDLLNPELQETLKQLVTLECFLGMGAAPECCSFSRAVTPAVRDALHPYGKDDITENMKKKVAIGNQHAAFLLALLLIMKLAFWVENPDGSFLWLLDDWLASDLSTPSNSFRFDQCVYSTPWRKRTRIATNTILAGERFLCRGGHSHQHLRGRSAEHGVCWTRVAQAYPRRLCDDLASAMALKMGLILRPPRFHAGTLAGCAHCSHARIGEAKNPGPRRRAAAHRRNLEELDQVQLVTEHTRKLQERVQTAFSKWMLERVDEDTSRQVFLCPALAAAVVENYGKHLYALGAPLYELRHLLVLLQQQYPLLRGQMVGAWGILRRWEELKPVTHRTPLPEILFKAMFAVGMFWKWRRWAATMLLGMEGIARIGEVLRATRADLVLPRDTMDPSQKIAFLRVLQPKTARRGKGRVQHLKIVNEPAVQLLELVFGSLDFDLQLFPMSAAAFRTRWEKVLDALMLPKKHRPTPSSVRGGGAIMAYRRGEAVADILWRMRLVAQSTLEHYLQELAAENLLTQLPEKCRGRIRTAASHFDFFLSSPGSAHHVR